MSFNVTDAFAADFTNGLIEGSSQLITNQNVGKVMAALKALSNVDTSAITQAADAAATGTAMALTSSTAGVAPTLDQLKTIFKAMQ